MSEQTIFKRTEIKYLLTRSQYETILKGISPYVTEDSHGKSRIQSLYYDTPDFVLARHSIDKPVYKEKFRFRSYGIPDDNSTVFMEIKKKYDGIVYKRRIASKFKTAEKHLSGNVRLNVSEGSADAQILKEIDYFFDYYQKLAPSIMLQYDRSAYYYGEGDSFRITFDDNILWRLTELDLSSGFYGTPLLDEDYVLMEVKVVQAMPPWFVELLTKNHIFPSSFSKYGTAYLVNKGLADRLPKSIYNVLNKNRVGA